MTTFRSWFFPYTVLLASGTRVVRVARAPFPLSYLWGPLAFLPGDGGLLQAFQIRDAEEVCLGPAPL